MNLTPDEVAKYDDVVGRLAPWIASPTRPLYIWGPVGTGKSHLARRIMTEWCALPRPEYRKSHFATAVSLLEKNVLFEHLHTAFLVLDDLPDRPPQGYDAPTLVNALKERYDLPNRVTIVTSVLPSFRALRCMYGEAVADRVWNSSLRVRSPFDKSLRPRKGADL